MEVNVYNQAGENVGKMKLNPDIFNIEIKPFVVHQVATAMMSNARRSWAHTKTRGEVRGGGRKPWRQKGTGRARQGSIRSPLWKGGGIIFGPRKERVYNKKINKKTKTKALLMCLTDKVKDNKLIVLDELKLEDAKTKSFVKILEKIPVEGKTLFILSHPDENIMCSSINLPQVAVKTIDNFNILDLLNYKFLVLTKETVKSLEKKYGVER
jgi:large subunit ribosomal protein L4